MNSNVENSVENVKITLSHAVFSFNNKKFSFSFMSTVSFIGTNPMFFVHFSFLRLLRNYW